MMSMDPTNGHGHAFSSSSFVSISSGPDGRPQVYQVNINQFLVVHPLYIKSNCIKWKLSICRPPPRPDKDLTVSGKPEKLYKTADRVQRNWPLVDIWVNKRTLSNGNKI